MKKRRISVLGLPVDALTMEETVRLIIDSILKGIRIHHVVVNAAKLVYAQDNEVLRSSIINCDIINADGQSIIWASKIMGNTLPERVTGIDLMDEIIGESKKNNFRIFFLGAKQSVLKAIIDHYIDLYGVDIIGGFHNGYFNHAEEEGIVKEIRESKSHVLFVAMPSPKKEIFLERYKDEIKTPFIMGVGGSFDVIAGKVKRAPVWMQKNGLEWLYRLIQEPKKMWRRYLITNIKFLAILLKEKTKQLLE